MSNDVLSKQGFQFKQFYIEHSRCAMKVGTDSIMLGSWVDINHVNSVLDIGTGSGLLAIMLAQRTSTDCNIRGIDIDAGAIQQAIFNGNASQWVSRLKFQQSRLQSFQPCMGFDLIVSNPPYYPAGQPLVLQKQQARHTSSLSHTELLEHSRHLLNDKGRLALVLPSQFCDDVIQQGKEQGLFLKRCMRVKTTSRKAVSRSLLEFALIASEIEYEELIIHRQDGEYSDGYRRLARDFYLYF